MRRYDMVFAILLILPSSTSLSRFLYWYREQKRQTYVNVEHIPRDVITVLGKRGSEEMERLIKEFIGTWKSLVESSDAHASSSSAPPVPDHGSMNEVNAPAPNPAPSPANPNPLMDPLSPSTIVHSPVVKGDALSDSESTTDGCMTATASRLCQWPPQRRQSLARTMN
ncbi:hypothetical protein BGY98DRAFT_186380 [Russula aff. rugulosa BPL654]|nr:hypothetical protein BGY98DRAFT_186380 [Russula aff. rugulosa BPL654]